MRYMIALVLAAFPALANITDSTYEVTPPITGTQCPAIQAGLEHPCYYVALGEFTDTYLFTVPESVTYAFEVTGKHWRRCTVSGRGTACYTESMTILDATVVDLATREEILALTSDAADDWTGSVTLAPGDYALKIHGVVGGNRPGVYGYSIGTGPVPADPTPIIVDDPTPIIVD